MGNIYIVLRRMTWRVIGKVSKMRSNDIPKDTDEVRFKDIPENIDENKIIKKCILYFKYNESIDINIQTKSQYDLGENDNADIPYELFRRYLNSAFEIIMSGRLNGDVWSFENMKNKYPDKIIGNIYEAIVDIIIDKYKKEH